ncbi:MAG: hypothetical protein EA355_14285 [Rhodobacteraceae bacterium]|nr:MAG: hypothetical protein EA355_14285 [Paracoccaceae bacterium]
MLELWAAGRLSGASRLSLRLAIAGYARGWIGRATFHRIVGRASIWHVRALRLAGAPSPGAGASGQGTQTDDG